MSSNYLVRSFRSRDECTPHAVSEIERGVCGDAPVVDAVIGKPLAVINPPMTRAMRAHHRRERRIVRGMFFVAILLVAAICLCACGGGNATAEEIAQADADRAAMQQAARDAERKTILPVFCGEGGVLCR